MLQLGSRYSAATLNNLNTTSAEDLFSLVICGYIGGRCVQLKYPTPQHGHLAAKSRPLVAHLGGLVDGLRLLAVQPRRGLGHCLWWR